MTDAAPKLSPEEEKKRTRGLRIVVIILLLLAVTLGTLLFRNYSRFLGYVNDTLDEREEPFPWDGLDHTPIEVCVDASMSWAANCVGIKSLCDEYVTRYMNVCLGSESRRDYCSEFTFEDTASTKFGAEECAARGVRRNVDKEACAKTYRAIDSWCQYERQLEAHEREAGEQEAQEEVEAEPEAAEL